jgi:hypothetical protein
MILLKTSKLAMGRMHKEDEMFRPPKYVVNSFLCSVHDDNSQLEVRRYESFVNSTTIKQRQYIDYLAAQRSDATHDNNMAEDCNPKDSYASAFEPCLPLFEAVIPARKQTLKITLYDLLHPGVFYYSLSAVDGEMTPVQSEGRRAGIVVQGLELDDSHSP